MLGKTRNKYHGTESNSPLKEQTNSDISKTETEFKDVFDHSLKPEDVHLLDRTKECIFQYKFNIRVVCFAWVVIGIFESNRFKAT